MKTIYAARCDNPGCRHVLLSVDDAGIVHVSRGSYRLAVRDDRRNGLHAENPGPVRWSRVDGEMKMVEGSRADLDIVSAHYRAAVLADGLPITLAEAAEFDWVFVGCRDHGDKKISLVAARREMSAGIRASRVTPA